jgi:hypothetical protein
MISGNVKLVLTNNEENLDINTLQDFDYCEYFLKTRKNVNYS